jgi:LacI family transcriptional regulator
MPCLPSNDLAAAGAMRSVIKAHGLRVPHDVAVAGFSNEPSISPSPCSTTVDQGCENYGVSRLQVPVRKC